MKKIFTSYYAKSGTHPQAIRISASAPSFFKGKCFPELYPTWDLIQKSKLKEITNEQYENLYKQLLRKRNITPEYIYDKLYDGDILLCYEKSGDFCHRRIVAKMMEDALKINIPELKENIDFISKFITI